MRVSVYERRADVAPLPNLHVDPIMPAGDYGAGAAKIAQDMLARLEQIRNDTEDARTLELFNDFKLKSQEYHENPDKGIYNTRLGYSSQGVYSEADQWMRKTGEDYVKNLRSGRSKKNLRRMMSDYILQRGLQNSRFEADQMKKYQAEQFQISYKNGLNEIALNPYDDNAVEQIKQTMTDALELQTRYSSPEAKKAAIADMENDIASARLTVMLQNNPEIAEKWFKENRNLFNAETLLKFDNSFESYRVQRAADELVKQFPQGYEQEALQWIRENFSGDREERIVSAYKSRINEREILENREEARLRKEQNDYYNSLERDFYLNGTSPDAENLRQAVISQRLRPEHAERLEGRQVTAASRSRIEKRILAQNPNLSQMELDAAVMRQMGTTTELYQNTFTSAFNAYMTKQIDDKGLKALHDRGLIFLSDTKRIKDYANKIDELGKKFYDAEFKELGRMIDKVLVNAGFPAEQKQGVLNAYTEEATIKLDPRSKTYKEDLENLRKKVLMDAMEGSGVDLKTWAVFGTNPRLLGFGGDKNTALGDIYEGLKTETLETRGINPTPEIEPLTPLDIALASVAIDTPSYSGNIKISSRIANYENEINNAATTFGVEPELIKAVMQVESGGRSGAVSNKGAQGLMQLMPETAKSLGVTDAFDPVQNINGGAKYLAQQLKKYNGDIEKTLWAYNAGPGRVAQGIKPSVTKKYISDVMSIYRNLKKNSNSNINNNIPEKVNLKELFMNFFTMTEDRLTNGRK